MSIPFLSGLRPALILAGCLAASSLAAQTPANCTKSEMQDPPRQEFTCADGVTIVIGEGAALGFGGAGGTGDLNLTSGAVFVSSDEGQPVQVSTPAAIAAVRGTQFAVSVGPEGTAVVVIRGEVEVSATEGDESPVLLKEGEGVDVIPGEPLKVKNWGGARVARMMDIFGR